MSADAIADGAVRRRVLVVGSQPPGGRDLDLLVRPEEEGAIARALAVAGYVRRGNTWARFAGGTADVVDLIPATQWRRDDHLFDDAMPLEGFEHLVVPAPHHDLLLAATLFLTPSGRLPAGRASRLATGPARDPEAWRRAHAEAHAWDAEVALERIHALFDGFPRRDLRGTARALRRRLRGPRGAVVALSGIDGSGKSTQAQALAESLHRLGHDAVIEWAPLAGDRWLDAIARPCKRLLGLIPALRPAPEAREEPARERGIVPNPGSELRARSALITEAWSTLVAVGNGVQHARRSAVHLPAGRVVVFDRYELDSCVRLRFLYGKDRSFRLQRRIIRALSPRPTAAFLLDVDAAVSFARKWDKWSPEELATQVRLYREERGPLGVMEVDGTRATDELAAQIAEHVWRALP